MPHVHLFTKGDRSFGTGHLHRTIWLRQLLAAQPGFDAPPAVWCASSPEAEAVFPAAGIAPRWSAQPVADWLETRTAGGGGKPVCVIDWLDSQPEAVHALRAAGARVVLLDDYGPAQAEAHLVINTLLAPLANSDEPLGRARVLSGAKYLALSPAVTRLRGVAHALNQALAAGAAVPGQLAPGPMPHEPGPVRAILVSGGGVVNPMFNTLALAALPYAEFNGVASIMPHRVDAPERKQLGGFEAAYYPAGGGLHDLLAASDLAFLAGGITLYEAAFLGVPALAVAVTEHQVATIRKLAKAGCCIEAAPEALSVARGPVLDPAAFAAVGAQLDRLVRDGEQRASLSRAGSQLFDGRGLQRTGLAIMELAGVA